ncbi:MAG: serine/threonine protein kinase, partial [Planctomycetales bacterium]
DVKPANLLVTSAGAVKILDMGLALLTDLDGGETDSTEVMGTTDYIAPEQAMNSQNIDHRADVYSLGCTMYFLLVGKPPFPEGAMHEVLLAHQIKQPTSVLKFRPDAPKGLVAVCNKMMAKKPDDRQQDAQQVADELADWLSANDWEGDPSLTGKRTDEESAQLQEMISQVKQDHREPKLGHGGQGAELGDFLTALDEESDHQMEPEEQLGSFLSNLEDDSESSSLSERSRPTRTTSGQVTPPPPRRTSKHPAGLPPPPRPAGQRGDAPPAKKKKTPQAKKRGNEEELTDFLNDLGAVDEESGGPQAEDGDLENFFDKFRED